jgi:hypothetical protein
MCILPPMCLFCVHYNQDAEMGEPDCRAFAEIPDAIFMGEFDHRQPYPGDRGVRFLLAPDMAEDYAEVMAVRHELQEAMRKAHEQAASGKHGLPSAG